MTSISWKTQVPYKKSIPQNRHFIYPIIIKQDCIKLVHACWETWQYALTMQVCLHQIGARLLEKLTIRWEALVNSVYGCPSEITLLFVWMLCRVLLQRSVRPWIFVTKVTHSLMQTHKRPHTHDVIMQMTFLISFWGGNQVHTLVEFQANDEFGKITTELLP